MHLGETIKKMVHFQQKAVYLINYRPIKRDRPSYSKLRNNSYNISRISETIHPLCRSAVQNYPTWNTSHWD